MSEDDVYSYLQNKSLIQQEIIDQLVELFNQLPERPSRGKKLAQALAFCAYRVVIAREDRVAIVTTMFDMTQAELAKVVTKYSVSNRMTDVVTPARIHAVAEGYWEKLMVLCPTLTTDAKQLFIAEIDKFTGIDGIHVTRNIKGVRFSGPITMIPVNDLTLSIMYYHINRMGYFGAVGPEVFVAAFQGLSVNTLIDLYQQLQQLDSQIK